MLGLCVFQAISLRGAGSDPGFPDTESREQAILSLICFVPAWAMGALQLTLALALAQTLALALALALTLAPALALALALALAQALVLALVLALTSTLPLTRRAAARRGPSLRDAAGPERDRGLPWHTLPPAL